MTRSPQPAARPHLSLVPGPSPEHQAKAEEDPGELLWRFVRSARRDMARLMRALQASGRGVASLPDAVTTRLAHADAVTARYLHAGLAQLDPEVLDAAEAMRELEAWIVERLTAPALAELRVHEIGVRIEDAELLGPLLRTEWAGGAVSEDRAGPGSGQEPAARWSLRRGLQGLEDAQLELVCRRLGLGAQGRAACERAVLETLLDGHLLAILIATLPAEAHRLLAAVIRDELDERERFAHAEGARLVDPRRHGVPTTTPADSLCRCALAFTDAGRLWVPPELHRRIDGVLRAFGV